MLGYNVFVASTLVYSDNCHRSARCCTSVLSVRLAGDITYQMK